MKYLEEAVSSSQNTVESDLVMDLATAIREVRKLG